MFKINFRSNNWIFKLSIILILLYVNIILYFFIFKVDDSSTKLNKIFLYIGFNILTILYLFIPFIVSVFVDIITKGVISYKWSFIVLNFSTVTIVLVIAIINLFNIKPNRDVNTKYIEFGTFSNEEQLIVKKQLTKIKDNYKSENIIFKTFCITTGRENSDSDLLIIPNYKMATVFCLRDKDSINFKISIAKYNSDFMCIKDSILNKNNLEIESIIPNGKKRIYEN